MSASRVPPYLTPGQIAKVTGQTARGVKKMLQRIGIAEQHGTQWVVGESRLRERLPEVYDRVFAAYELGDQFDPD